MRFNDQIKLFNCLKWRRPPMEDVLPIKSLISPQPMVRCSPNLKRSWSSWMTSQSWSIFHCQKMFYTQNSRNELNCQGVLPHSAQRKSPSYRMAEGVVIKSDLTSLPPPTRAVWKFPQPSNDIKTHGLCWNSQK